MQALATQGGGDVRGAALTRAGGVDAAPHRPGPCQAGRLPNLKEHPRQRPTTQRGRQRGFQDAIQALRLRGERPGAWEETGQRLLRRCARSPPRH